MQTASKICEHCGDKVFDDAPRGLCPGCALETGLGMLQDEFDETTCACRAPVTQTAGGPADILGLLGDYELLEEIGRGGQGVVYKARQKSLNRIVAVKVIGLGRWAAKADIERFRLEAEAAASLDHPCIVPIHEIGETDGSCYFSMNLIDGARLDDLVNHKSMTPRRAAEITAKLARTIQHAHERGILHRDIKPGNVLIDKYGELHLTDFGLARLVEKDNTKTGTMAGALGTPSYMSPEQAAGRSAQLTSATDVYGLGAVFYHLLTGHPPFAGDSAYETVRQVLEDEPRQPQTHNREIDHDLTTICLKCLLKDPQRRYASALALAEDLERWLRYEPICARRSGVITRTTKWVRRHPSTSITVISILVLTLTLFAANWQKRTPSLSNKGVAVLPFENLSSDREDTFFADGVQDDLLTKLAKISDLKVISRTSVMQYRGNRNLRQIGNDLQVSHVLEGSVRKTGAWLHVNAQLIDARTDTHVWAEQYDRDLKDVFAIESEVTQEVAKQLHAKISAAERVAIERPATADLTAFDLYSRAKNLVLEWSYRMSGRDDLTRAADLLNHALAHDPTFFQGHCLLAWIHDQLYTFGFDRTPWRLQLADAAIQAAFRIHPDAGEAHLALAGHLYRGYRDFDGAITQLETAGKTLPNDARLFELKGLIERRRPGGNQEEALGNFKRALDLDPRNFLILQQTSLTYDNLRRYRDEELIFDRMLAIRPDDAETKVDREFMEFDWKADTRPLHQVIDLMQANPSTTANIAGSRLLCALAERDPAAAKDALIALGDTPLNDDVILFNRPFLQGLIARMTNHAEQAQSSFSAARVDQEKTVHAQPNYGPPLCVLGLIDAALGRKEEALREGKRAVDLLPVEKDALGGIAMIEYLAMIAAWAGDSDLACEQLAIASTRPGSLSYGKLKLMPFWDPLRADPRFEQIVASLAPKGTGERSTK